MLDNTRLEQIRSNTQELEESVHGSTEYYLRKDAEVSVSDLKDLLAEVKTLRAKVKSGVEAAHDIQKAYYDHERPKSLSWYDRDFEDERLCEKDEAANTILTAMEEPEYHETLLKESNDN
jgi:hypothetical protein